MRCSIVCRRRRGSANRRSEGLTSTSSAYDASPRPSSRCRLRPFTASAVADQTRAFGDQSLSAYSPRQAAYDLKKMRGKQILQRIGATRRYEAIPSGLRAITAVLTLRDKAIKPLLAAVQKIAPTHNKTHQR